MKILRVLQENNMTESVKTFKKEYETLFNKTTILTITLLSEPYFNTLDGYIAYVQEQPDSNLIEKDQLDEAQRFFMTYVKNTNLQATVFASHKDNLYRIKLLIRKEQIAQSEYVKSFRHNGRY
ncbi:unnamed protein product [Rotaria sordida]|nr:unnamed protein product [Rotaria sordida]CAF4069403.1 unnamed protein product [Rotaria sordida]